ncbi:MULTISPECIES: TonB-dependent siderophore receptor [unclassified Uliginosibacterium]|uniref:TonB-dependent receptor n=1 Tax=unclassified Uliginosibacterium TaxID=2621521 RepID=UPI000C7C8843|nr:MULTISPECIES: TonB-dependent siderophore receptor [unclassified Uliginosibacterium]MDO6386173.1 TonB-dependent siderophore receptor [Uliginosibacterium sp. 31-12]PLK49240.1 TonB-dependent siderophore receptor [Uliginosibacterium sp. TH139]
MRPNSLRVSRLALAVNLALMSLAASQSVLAQTSPAKTDEKTLGTVRVTADKPVEIEAKSTYQATTTTIGKGKQALRDIPQSVTVVTEKLIDDRNLDTLKDVLHQTAGVTFLAAEGGEEDIRLRGFSLQQSGDIYIDGMRDPGIYERDTFNYDRVEVLRGSASMLFGRGSTGGVVNQVSKQAFLMDQNEVDFTYGTGNYKRLETDLNIVTGQASAFRLTAMKADAENNGSGSSIDKEGAAGNFRYGIGERDEFTASLYYLKNRNGINYGLPWLAPDAQTSGLGLIDKDPSAYYGVDSDYANSDILHGTVGHIHRFSGQAELKTVFRAGQYNRDQRASAVRFAAASAQPNRQSVYESNISDNTVLTRGSNNKAMDLEVQSLQSDYSDKLTLLGMKNEILSGVDINHERRNTYGFVTPAGVNLTKSNTTLGDDDGTSGVTEELRQKLRSADFDYLSAGAYFQDLVQIAENWKLLGGLRYDYANGEYRTWGTSGATAGTVTANRGRHDKMPSKRFGAMYQPSAATSFHFSWGTSFNTSGDTYQYDALGSNTDPEKSKNVEVGSKLEFFGGDMSVRTALFKSTKYNERNTDTDTVNATNYVLSGERYTKGAELDLAGRITPAWEAYLSYSWIPVAKISKGALTGSEQVGQRPGLIPKHQASLWSTYKVSADWRLGAGVAGRTKMYPQLINTNQVEGYLTYDAMVEYAATRDLTLKLNGTNLGNKLYADNVYRGHYIPGKGRTFELTASYKF